MNQYRDGAPTQVLTAHIRSFLIQCDENNRTPTSQPTPSFPPNSSPMSDQHSKSSSTQGEKIQGAVVTSRDVDVGAELIAGKDIHLSPEEASRLR
jgi:hypothetical protein